MTNDKPFTKAGDFPPEVLKLLDQYVHNAIDRRGFLEGAAKFAVGGVTAAGFLEALSPRFAEAQQVRRTIRASRRRRPNFRRRTGTERRPDTSFSRRPTARTPAPCRRCSSPTRTGG